MTIGAGLCLALALGNDAAAQSGNGQLVGRSVLAVSGCGRQRGSFAATIAIDPDGRWSAEDSEGQPFTGTWTPKGSSGRKVEAVFDPETEAAFLTVLLNDVAELCEIQGSITVTSVMKQVFTLALNRKRTRVTLVLRYAVRGSSEEDSGTARYRVKAKGAWTPAALAQ